MADVTDIINYYVNLLIIQYSGKPKAQATIRLLAEETLASGIFLDVENGYNLENAVGVQLDVIGKYVGVDRYFRGQIFDGYFAFVKYDEDFGSISPAKKGFCDYSNIGVKVGKWLKYSDIISTTYQLNDDDYRVILKMKIFQNNSNMSHKEIDDFIFGLFGTAVTVSSTGNMHINYTSDIAHQLLIQVAIEKDVLPRPMGVNLVF